MMGVLFLKASQSIEELSIVIAHLLGGQSPLEGDSLNVLGGYYQTMSLLGLNVKVEYNSYDYEDRYNYMISVTKHYHSSFELEKELLELTTEVIGKLLAKNLGLEIAYEQGDSLLLFQP